MMRFAAYSIVSRSTRSRPRTPSRGGEVEDEEEYVVFSITRRRGGTQWSTQRNHPLLFVMEYTAYSSSSSLRWKRQPNCEVEDEEEYVAFSIARRKKGTRWNMHCIPPLLLVMEEAAYSLPPIICRRTTNRPRI